MNAFYDPQMPQPSLVQADLQHPTSMNAYRTDFEVMQSQSTPYSTWSQVNPSDYNASQPQSEEYQHIYGSNENPFPEPYTYSNCAATFISTSGPQTGSFLNLDSLYPPQVMEPKLHNSYVTNSTNSVEEDGVSNGRPPSGKKRRGRFSPEGREKTKNVRKLGSCARCRKMKLGVIFSLLLLSRAVCLHYLSATRKHPAASAQRYSAKLGLTTSRAAMII